MGFDPFDVEPMLELLTVCVSINFVDGRSIFSYRINIRDNYWSE